MNVKKFSVLALTPESEGQLYAIQFSDQPVNELERWRIFFSDSEQLKSELTKRGKELIRDNHDPELILQKALSEGNKFIGLFEEAAKAGDFSSVLQWKDFEKGLEDEFYQKKGESLKTIYAGPKEKEIFENRIGDLVEYDTSHCRLFGLKYEDDTLVIIGGCLKTTRSLQKSDFTRNVPASIRAIAEVFSFNEVIWANFNGTDFELTPEDYEEDA